MYLTHIIHSPDKTLITFFLQNSSDLCHTLNEPHQIYKHAIPSTNPIKSINMPYPQRTPSNHSICHTLNEPHQIYQYVIPSTNPIKSLNMPYPQRTPSNHSIYHTLNEPQSNHSICHTLNEPHQIYQYAIPSTNPIKSINMPYPQRTPSNLSICLPTCPLMSPKHITKSPALCISHSLFISS